MSVKSYEFIAKYNLSMKTLLIETSMNKISMEQKEIFFKTSVHKLLWDFLYSRSIQVGPMKPAVQTHLNFSSSLKHLAPFLQGSSPQGFAKKKPRDICDAFEKSLTAWNIL